MHIYLWLSNILHSILMYVLCKKWSNTHSNLMVRGSGFNKQFLWDHVSMDQPITHNTQTRWQDPVKWPRGIFEPIEVIQDGSALPCLYKPAWPHFCKLFEGIILNNYVDIQQQIMQVRFIIFLCTWGYNSLGNPTRQHNVWRKTCLNTNWSKWHLPTSWREYSASD